MEKNKDDNRCDCLPYNEWVDNHNGVDWDVFKPPK